MLAVVFRLILLSFATLLCSASFAPAQTPRVCQESREEALGQFEEFHELATRSLLKARSVSLKPRPFDDLAGDARRFVAQHERSALLVFAWDENDLCLFLWPASAPDQAIYVRLPGGRGKLIGMARQLRELAQAQMAVASRLPRKRGATAYDSAGPPSGDIAAITDELSALLFPPELREALARTQRLSIVPVGPIATIPLYMLEPLGDDRVAAEIFSINILTLMEDIQEPMPAPPRAKAKALILGNPTTRDAEWDFPDLPGGEAEARFAHAIFGGTMLTRDQATMARFEDLAPAADLIVLAAHGVADETSPLDESFLALAGHRLSPREIQSLDFDRRPLVVLSACQSGLGRTLDAGVIGIARAFQLAGAANTVMSLWSVDDDATRILMEHFYRLLADHDAAEALRRATLVTRERFPSPGQWASFAVFGGP